MAAMWTYAQNDENVSVQMDSYYEERASEEEIYLEEREEEVRMILEFDDQPLSLGPEKLVIGDSEDTLLKRESIEEMSRAL